MDAKALKLLMLPMKCEVCGHYIFQHGPRGCLASVGGKEGPEECPCSIKGTCYPVAALLHDDDGRLS